MTETGAATRRYGCPSCGGGLKYDIASGKMVCDRCGGLTPMSSLPEEPAGDTLEVTEFHCPQCGAAVYSTDTEVTSFCSFCGSDVVLTGRLGHTRRPEEIVPFTVTREDCEKAYRDHLRRYHLAPAYLKEAETISHFRPVYVPFWSYEVEAEGPARLEGKKSYTKGDYHYDETYDLYMDAEIRQKGILYDASTAFEDETAAMLQHTDKEARPFHPAYLSGLYAQGADVEAETYHSEAAASAVRIFMEKVREKNKMDSVEMKGDISENFGLPHARYREKLVMLPVWLLAKRQGERVVYTAVNGASGEVVCDVPVSNGRVAAVTAALAAVLFALLWQFLTLRPELLMALCSVISLITVYQFSGAQKRLYNRRTRAFEPKFGKGESFVGPAQAMLKVKEDGIAARKSVASDLAGKAGNFAMTALGIGVIAIGTGASSMVMQMFSSSGMQKICILAVAAVLAVMLVHTLRRLRGGAGGPRWPRILSCVACAAGLVSLLTGQVEDMVYYACAGAMMLAAILELVMINRAHNEYASRPVPFFDREEERA